MMARSRAIDARRRARPAEALHDVHADPAPGPADAALHREAMRGLLAALDELPPEQRRAVLLAAGDLTAEEIANATGAPLGTVKSRVRLGRRRMTAAMAR